MKRSDSVRNIDQARAHSGEALHTGYLEETTQTKKRSTFKQLKEDTYI